ncbi:MAG: M23 family metallopeptidase [Oscillospiraceae bacterium]|nr:M23 family metallopeptidase [Oscillospiraceae bacterium]
MDNDFYEYSRSARRQSTENEKPKNIMTKIIIIQLILSLAVTGILFAVCRTDGKLSKNIKSFYSDISQKDMSVSEVFGVFKRVAQSTFAPSIKQEDTYKENEESTNETSAPSGETVSYKAGEKAIFSPVYLTVKLLTPVDSKNITSNFGYRISPITGEYSLHTGLDIAAPKGTKITAAYSGTVEKADFNDTRGNYIIIKHSDSLKTTYNHCSELLVTEGTVLRAGETIALVGSTGAATGDHLHFEITVDGKYIDPLWVLTDAF